jgi:hypothetical protein
MLQPIRRSHPFFTHVNHPPLKIRRLTDLISIS